jgi:hypothetical protein
LEDDGPGGGLVAAVRPPPDNRTSVMLSLH